MGVHEELIVMGVAFFLFGGLLVLALFVHRVECRKKRDFVTTLDDIASDELGKMMDAATFAPGVRLRAAAAGSMFWGGVAIWMGIRFGESNPLQFILVPLGAILVGEGAYFQARPSAKGLIYDAGALLLLAVWNIAIWVHDGSPLVLALGLCQIGWAVNSAYHGVKTRGTWPSGVVMRRLERLRKYVKQAKPKKVDNVVELDATRVGLFRSFAVLVPVLGNEMTIVPRHQVAIVDSTELPKRRRQATVRFKDRHLAGPMSESACETLAKWVPQDAQQEEGAEEATA